MKIRCCLMLAFCCFCFASFSQTKKEKTTIANKHIEKLREGVLLVQLDSKYGEIFTLKKYLKQQMADDLKQQQQLRNKEICLAFREEFDFCEVYFYYKSFNKFLLDGNVSKVVFYNDKLEIDYDFDVTAEQFYIAAFEDFSKPGLQVYNKELEPLTKPFPNYEKEHKFIFKKRDAFEVVNRWNEKLHNFLARYEYNKKYKK